MIRFARIHAESDVAPPGLDELVSGGGLDLVQLDYERPRAAPVAGATPPEIPERAVSFFDALRGVAKSLFLEPSLRIITSAGWSNSYVCSEMAGRLLAESGCADLPVSAVRGANLLPILDQLVAEGLRLDNVDTGAPWHSLRAPVLAADLEYGAGPFTAALAEGGRVIIAGAYDGAAPAIAAAVNEFGWSWKELDHLAGAAAAARAALWPHRHACEWLSAAGTLPAAQIHPRVELDANGQFTVDLTHAFETEDAARLRQWLQTGHAKRPVHDQADVRWDATQADVAATGPTQFRVARVAGVAGAKGDDSWRLKVLYQTGFLAETMIEFAAGAAAPTLRGQIAEAFRVHFVDADEERSFVTVQELGAADGQPDAASWLHLACRMKARRSCMEFVEHVARFAAANPKLVRLPAGRPTVQAECGVWPARVPRSAIDVAVDTRPAKEWE